MSVMGRTDPLMMYTRSWPGLPHLVIHDAFVIPNPILKGETKDDKWHGEGVLHRADGALYVGQWKEGLMHGKGDLQYGETDRLDRYCGGFCRGMRDGQGVLTWADGRRYDGQWRENQINGEGCLEYTKNDQFQRLKYQGQFLNDMRHGQGRLDWGDGRWYEGPWQHDAVLQQKKQY